MEKNPKVYKEISDGFGKKTLTDVLNTPAVGSDIIQGGVAQIYGGYIGGSSGIRIIKGGFETTRIRAYLASNATIVTGAARKVLFDTIDYDSLNEFDETTNNRFIVNKKGYYLINSIVQLDTVTDALFYEILIYKNNAAISRSAFNSSGTTFLSLNISDVVYLEKDDYIEIFVDSAEAGNYTAVGGITKTFLNIHRLF